MEGSKVCGAPQNVQLVLRLFVRVRAVQELPTDDVERKEGSGRREDDDVDPRGVEEFLNWPAI